MKKHNGTIDLWKFIYCLMIIALHVGVLEEYLPVRIRFAGGSIGVEFFFIVSGYLLGKKALNILDYEDLGLETKTYMSHRLKSLFSMTAVVFVFSFLYFTSIKEYAVNSKINFVWDLLLLRNAGIKYHTLIYVGWYTSVLAFVSLILFPIVCKYKNKFLYILGPVFVIGVGSYVAYKWGNTAWDGEYYTKCFLRGFFEMSLGVCLIPGVEKLKNLSLTRFGTFFVSLLEIGGFLSILVVANVANSHAKYDFVCILIFAICILIAFSEKSVFSRWTSNKFCYFLGKLSFPMFLSQGLIIEFVKNVFSSYPIPYFLFVFLVFVGDCFFSIVCLKIVDVFSHVSKNMKRVFIKEEVLINE